jgi:hypothetical protein
VKLVDMLWMKQAHPFLAKNLINPISERLSTSAQKSSLMILQECYRDKQFSSGQSKTHPLHHPSTAENPQQTM